MINSEPPISDESIRVSQLTRYPVKSCRAENLDSATVEPWGLVGDRRWMLVDESGAPFTARQSAQLLLVRPEITDEGLVLHMPGQEPLRVPRPSGQLAEVNVWGPGFQAEVASEEVSDWFRLLTGQDIRLVYLDDPRQRPTNPARSQDGDVVSFADGYPLLLASTSSLAELNTWVADGPRSGDGPMPMTRFRPNVVVDGALPWVEDSWRRIMIGNAGFRVVKGCDRCSLTMIDPETTAKTKEPLVSLARHRQLDHKVWFAVNLIPDDPGATITVGDKVTVLEAADSWEPQR